VKPEDLEKIASTVLELTGFPPVKANWDNWIEMIKAFKPRLIIVLPHMEAISEFEATLEINTKKKPYRDITEAHIRANAEYRPIVALLGCDTAGTEFKYIDFVQTFSDNKAGIVIGTVASILGIHASKIAEMLLKGLEEVKENTRLSDLMRIIKCKAIKDNLIMAMSVVAFGDADWILTKK
jgi:hypothetical protein